MALSQTDADTCPKLLLHQSGQRGGSPAIREKRRGIWHTTTWRDLADEATAVAAALCARGLARGAHVALIGDNRPRLYAAIAATHGLGAVAVPLFQDMTADELLGPIGSAGVTHVFVEDQEQVDKLLTILPRCPTVRCIVYDKDRGLRHYRQHELVSYAALVQQGREIGTARGADAPSLAAQGSGQDAAFLFFTAGTTGPAKGVVVRQDALVARARAAAALDRVDENDVAMAYLPPGWIGQILQAYVQPLVAGSCICCPELPETLIDDMREAAPTQLLGTPRIFAAMRKQLTARLEDSGGLRRALFRRSMTLASRVGPRLLSGAAVAPVDRLAHAATDLLFLAPLRESLGMGRMRLAYTTGDTITPDLMQFYRALGINLKQLYGSTETLFFAAVQRDASVRPGTTGRPAEQVELRIGAAREILVRSPYLFDAYAGDGAATARAMDDEGWFRTGDVGEIGPDGELRVLDRLADTGTLADGSPFAPKAVETRLNAIPYVKDAVVFGPNRDRVCALIDIDATAVGRWADSQSIPYTGHADLAADEKVCTLLADAVAEVNRDLAEDTALAGSQVHRFLVLPKELSAEDGELTYTGKLRRGAIAERYAPLIHAMYGGYGAVRPPIPAGEEGEPAGPGVADLPIREARTVAAATVRNAA